MGTCPPLGYLPSISRHLVPQRNGRGRFGADVTPSRF